MKTFNFEILIQKKIFSYKDENIKKIRCLEYGNNCMIVDNNNNNNSLMLKNKIIENKIEQNEIIDTFKNDLIKKN